MTKTSADNLSERDIRWISTVVHSHCGINLHDGKRELVKARVNKRVNARGFRSASDYMQSVLDDPDGEELLHLVDALSTNFTSFYREQNHFDFLATEFLPELIRRKRDSRRLRAWSAGCSSGEEAYSIAMTLASALPETEIGSWDTRILATDISNRMLIRARHGSYTRERVQAVPAMTRHKWLIPARENGRKVFHVSPKLREMVAFRYLNLIEDWPFEGPFDFIFCRNVMIYFDKATQETLVNRFWDVLDAGGILFTGHAESLTGINHKFKYMRPTIYVKP